VKEPVIASRISKRLNGEHAVSRWWAIAQFTSAFKFERLSVKPAPNTGEPVSLRQASGCSGRLCVPCSNAPGRHAAELGRWMEFRVLNPSKPLSRSFGKLHSPSLLPLQLLMQPLQHQSWACSLGFWPSRLGKCPSVGARRARARGHHDTLKLQGIFFSTSWL
jgi:hypothetical protein